MNMAVAKPKNQEKYVAIKVIKEADRLLEIAAAFSGVYKSELLLKLAKCPSCGVLLISEAESVLRCPACGARYELRRL
jgi:rubrerythrin